MKTKSVLIHKRWLRGGVFCRLYRLTCIPVLITVFLMQTISVLSADTQQQRYQKSEFTAELRPETASMPELSLYSQAAVLMDADSGRILYSKNGQEQLPMASTTKIMTLIVTLENADLEEVVEVSDYAASMPDVQLNMRSGEHYRLGDLVYSLMLESHNDSAVAIAEHVAGSVGGFTEMMNQKARELGCEDTCFITPNGLDASAVAVEDDGQTQTEVHSTTASELARIMTYCITESPKRELFLEITRTAGYGFTNLVQEENGSYRSGNRSFNCTNHNAFLTMMEGAVSGKTGFTGNAGYCYVGALTREGRTFVVALLACGWPPNKSYKWSDTRKLMEYGIANYQYHAFDEVQIDKKALSPVHVLYGQGEGLYTEAKTDLKAVPGNAAEAEKTAAAENSEAEANTEMAENTIHKAGVEGALLREGEQISIRYDLPKQLTAPVSKGTVVGKITYMIGDETWKQLNVITGSEVKKTDYPWVLKMLFLLWLL